MKPCILLFPVTICYIICGIHGVWQNNGRSLFSGLGGRAGQLRPRGIDSASGYNVGDTNYVNNGDKTPIIVPLNGVEDNFDKGVKSSANEYHKLAPQVSVVGPNKERGNGGLNGGESNANGNLNYALQNNEKELHSFNIGEETNDDGNVNMLMTNIVDDNVYDKSQNNTMGSLNVGMKANANVNLSGHSQNVDIGIGGESSDSNLNFTAQGNVNEKGGVNFYPPYSEGGLNIGAEKFNLPTQVGFHNINVAAKGDIGSRGFDGQVNGGGVLNSEILSGGGYNMGDKGILNSYYNLPVQNNKIHDFYIDWPGNKGRDPNIVSGVVNGYLNYPLKGIDSPNKGLQSGSSYINYQHNDRTNGLYEGGDPRLSGGGGGFNVEEVASSYFNYPEQYNAVYRPYHGDSTYFSANGNGGRDINLKTQGGDERGYKVAGHYYNLPKQDSRIQIKEGSYNAKGNDIASNNYNVVVHGQNLANNANHELYTGGQSNANGGRNVVMQNGGFTSKIKGNSINNSHYKLPIQGLPTQGHLRNLNLPGDNTNSNYNHASQNFINIGEKINKEISPYFKIEGDGKGGFHFVPFRISGCSCQNINNNVKGELKLPGSLNGGVQSNGDGKLGTDVQINMGDGIKTEDLSNFEGNIVGKANLIGDVNNRVQNQVKSQFQGNSQTNIGGDLVTGELNNVEAYSADQGKLVGDLNNDHKSQNIVEGPFDGSTQANTGGNYDTKFLVEDNNLNSQVNFGGNIAQNKLMKDMNGLDYLHRGINGYVGEVDDGRFRDLGEFSNFGDGIIPSWFQNTGSRYTNVVGGLNTGGGIYGGNENDYLHGVDSYNGIPNNRAHLDGEYLGPKYKVDDLNSADFAHFKGQENNYNPYYKIIVRKGDKFSEHKGKPQISLENIHKGKPKNSVNDRLSDIFKVIGSRLDGDGLGPKGKAIGSRLDGDGFEPKGKPQINLENIFKGKPQSNVNDGVSDIFKAIWEGKLDGDGFRNAKEEFNNDKLKHFKFNDDITGVLPQWYQNNRNYVLKIVFPKAKEESGVNDHQVINRDQLNTSNRTGYSKEGYRLPKLGTIERQRSFGTGYSGRIGRLRGYNKVFRG